MQAQYLCDYHVHTVLSGHGEGRPEEFIKFALARGLNEVGFSEHYLPPMAKKMIGYPEGPVIIEQYVNWMKEIKAAHPDYRIRVGIEVDYFPGREKEIEQVVQLYPWDYIIGSVHFIRDWAVDSADEVENFRRFGVNRAYREYFAIVREAIGCKLFDIIGHIDVVKKFGHRYDGSPLALYEQTVEALARGHCATEINTAGLRKPVGEFYPAFDLLKMCAEAKVPLTLGSDAHAPREIGFAFDEALHYAKQAGYRELICYEGRKPSAIPIF